MGREPDSPDDAQRNRVAPSLPTNAIYATVSNPAQHAGKPTAPTTASSTNAAKDAERAHPFLAHLSTVSTSFDLRNADRSRPIGLSSLMSTPKIVQVRASAFNAKM